MNRIENNPNNDGITHINIYSKGKTELGRLLTNFAYTPIDLGEHGNFDSIEGYWYWLLIPEHNKHPDKEQLRTLIGGAAKKKGLQIIDFSSYGRKYDTFGSIFKSFLIKALEAKYEQHPKIKELMLENTLPFKHYYFWENVGTLDGGHEWLTEFWQNKSDFLHGKRLF